MVKTINVNITDNSVSNRKTKTKTKTKTTTKTTTKKPRKTRKDKGIPRGKRTQQPIYVAPTQRGTYAYNAPIALDPPFVEQSKIQLQNLTQKVNEAVPQTDAINARILGVESKTQEAQETSFQFASLVSQLGKTFPLMVKEEVEKIVPIRRGRRTRKPLKEVIDDDSSGLSEVDINIQEPPIVEVRAKSNTSVQYYSDEELPNLDEAPPPPVLRRSSSVKERIEEIERKIKPLDLPQPLEAEPIQQKERVPTPPSLSEANETIQMMKELLKPPSPKEPTPPPSPKEPTPPPSPKEPLVRPPPPPEEVKPMVIAEPPKPNLFQEIDTLLSKSPTPRNPPTPPPPQSESESGNESDRSISSISSVEDYTTIRREVRQLNISDEDKQTQIEGRAYSYKIPIPSDTKWLKDNIERLTKQKQKANEYLQTYIDKKKSDPSQFDKTDLARHNDLKLKKNKAAYRSDQLKEKLKFVEKEAKKAAKAAKEKKKADKSKAAAEE